MEKQLDLLGILNSPQTYCGPGIVQIDLTNNCNNSCLACWCHSPLLGKQRMTGDIKKMHLSFQVIKKTIFELKEMGTKEIILAGSGDPLMHPDINEILKEIFRARLKCNLITNGLLIHDKIAREIVNMNLHTLTISVWAGDPKAYVLTHPGKSEEDFACLEKTLLNISNYKREKNSPFPFVKIVNVIMHQNVNNISQMVDFALKVNANQIEFNLVDIIPDKTSSLALSKEDNEIIQTEINKIRQRKEYTNAFNNELPGPMLDTDVQKESNFNDKLIIPLSGFNFDYDRSKLYCPTGQETGMHYCDWNTNQLIFQFNMEQCSSCKLNNNCGIEPHTWTYKVPTLDLSNCTTILRRSMSMDNHDKSILAKIPCYIGWIYSRILSNGDVIPCCRAYKKPLGNIFHQSFHNIWYSKNYTEFRDKALNLAKSHPYFKDINCLKGCDNLSMILDVHQRIENIRVNPDILWLKQ